MSGAKMDVELDGDELELKDACDELTMSLYERRINHFYAKTNGICEGDEWYILASKSPLGLAVMLEKMSERGAFDDIEFEE